ncbi:MFS transporter [Maribacter ulvicola]|uniref:Sugar phosphate permease n=1 Tax=Maribacter ulvicola TaxID=228959 RepID=A0A1N6QSC1_9FLAO|nr:MFS transporter [Maribacter ulvicola]SIQ19529.1 Sugar phosphate permease [Maribacter ulvicola]
MGTLIGSRKYYYGWVVAIVGTLGMMFSVNTFKIFSFGVFVNPLHETFGWSKGDIFYTVSIISFVTVFTSFLSGYLIDKIGPRKLIFYSTLLVGMNIAGLYFINSNIWLFYGLFVLMTIIGCGTLPGVYSKEILVWFEKKKGMALSIVSSGISIGAMIFPVLITVIITYSSWREAYLIIGVLVFLMAFILKRYIKYSPEYFNLGKDGVVLHDKHYSDASPIVKVKKAKKIGVRFSKAIRTIPFWLLGIIFFCVGLGNTGIIVNLFPFMEYKGYSVPNVALISFAFGFSLIIGRYIGGYLFDRLNPYLVMSSFYVSAALALVIVIYVTQYSLVLVGIILIGVTLGSTIPAIMYFLNSLYGFRDFGKIQGFIFSIFQIGGIFGPFLIGYEENHFGTSQYSMITFSILYVVSAALLLYMPLKIKNGL